MDNRVSRYSIRIGSVRKGNHITRLTIIITEITAQQDAETALRAREELCRMISTITADDVFSTQLEIDSRLHLKWVGGGFKSMMGDTLKEYAPRGGWLAALHPDDQEVDTHDMACLQKRHWVRVYVHPLWGSEHNRLTGIHGTVQDITGCKQAEAKRLKYRVSHELNSPIVTFKGFLGSIVRDLRDGKYERAQQDLLRISIATDKTHGTLSNLLQLSRLGRIVNPPKEVDLVQLAQKALKTADGRLQDHNVTVHIAPDHPSIYGDRVRLRDVYENLIDHAAKHVSDQSAPQIKIAIRKNENEIAYFVKGNSMRIDLQYHKRIFTLFENLDAASEGTGVGLALVKPMIETHGGRIQAESGGLGKGFTFSFTIPDGRNSEHQ